MPKCPISPALCLFSKAQELDFPLNPQGFHIPDSAAYLFGDAACQSIAAQMMIMPQALLTARLCPRGAEATVFAILAGFQNFGSNIGSILGAQLAESYEIQMSREGPCEYGKLKELIVVTLGLERGMNE